MVDHWPKSYILSEDEEKMIKDYRLEKELMEKDGKCKECNGSGKDTKSGMILLSYPAQYRTCASCKGTGFKNEQSPNMKAVEQIIRLAEYIAPHSGFFGLNPNPVNVVNLAIEIADKNEESSALIASWYHKYLNTYQDEASKTAIYPGKGTPLGLIYCALKLSGEAGEVAENVGKAIRDDGLVQYWPGGNTVSFSSMDPERLSKLKLELGDVLWYVSQAAKELGFTLEEIAQANLEKLGNRAKNGTLKGSGDDR